MLLEPGLTSCHQGMASLWLRTRGKKSAFALSVPVVYVHSRGWAGPQQMVHSFTKWQLRRAITVLRTDSQDCVHPSSFYPASFGRRPPSLLPFLPPEHPLRVSPCVRFWSRPVRWCRSVSALDHCSRSLTTGLFTPSQSGSIAPL